MSPLALFLVLLFLTGAVASFLVYAAIRVGSVAERRN